MEQRSILLIRGETPKQIKQRLERWVHLNNVRGETVVLVDYRVGNGSSYNPLTDRSLLLAMNGTFSQWRAEWQARNELVQGLTNGEEPITTFANDNEVNRGRSPQGLELAPV